MVKVFMHKHSVTSSKEDELENKINAWLTSRDVKILKIVQSSAGCGNWNVLITVTIEYV